jgi:hypothetical protein
LLPRLCTSRSATAGHALTFNPDHLMGGWPNPIRT